VQCYRLFAFLSVGFISNSSPPKKTVCYSVYLIFRNTRVDLSLSWCCGISKISQAYSVRIVLLPISISTLLSFLMAISLSHLLEMLPFRTQRVEKIDCYHCGEKMRETKALYIKFNGHQRAVCCHGCLAILHAIERNKMVDEYLQTKSPQTEVL